MKHFKLRTDLTIEIGGKTLFRIEATRGIEKLGVKKGDLGGFVESEKNLSDNAWVSGNARVYDNAQVYGDALVSGDAQVSGDAWVYGDARVYGNAQVSGDAWVYDNAQVYGDARVYGNAQVSGDAQVYGNAQVYGDALVSGDAQVYGDALVSGDAWVYGDQIEKGNDLINITSNVNSYNITITPNHIRIGCQYHSKTAWFRYTENEIRKMDGERAVKWWKTWKPILKAICNGLKGKEK